MKKVTSGNSKEKSSSGYQAVGILNSNGLYKQKSEFLIHIDSL